MFAETLRDIKALLFIAMLAVAEIHHLQHDVHFQKMLQASKADQDVQGHMKSHAEQTKTQEQAMHFSRRIQQTLAQSDLEEHVKCLANQMEAILVNSNLQGQEESVAQQVEAMLTSPSFQEEMKVAAQQMQAIRNNPIFQDELQLLAEQMERLIANPNFKQQATLFATRIDAILVNSSFESPKLTLPRFRNSGSQLHGELNIKLAAMTHFVRAPNYMDKLVDSLANNIFNSSYVARAPLSFADASRRAHRLPKQRRVEGRRLTSFFKLKPDSAVFWYDVAGSIALVLFGGLMSGLTLGLMSFEDLDMAVIQRSGNQTEKRQAAKVKNLIKNPHQLLVTLLLCNAAAMEMLPLVLDNLVHPIVAIVLSVTAVLAFGEIIPQAVCKTHGLAIGAASAPIVKALMFLCLPLSWPIGKLLDCLLGHDGGRLYKRAQMAAFVDIHQEQGELIGDEATVIRGALELRKPCSEIMTPIEKVKMLPSDAKLDAKTMDWIIYTGHSRMPVYDVVGDKPRLSGVLLVKRLLKLRPQDAARVSEVKLDWLFHVTESLGLYGLLDMFQTGRSHMAAVYPAMSKIEDVKSPPFDGTPAIGIVTLEDVIEELIREEIVDETDRVVDAATDTGNPEAHRQQLPRFCFPWGRQSKIIFTKKTDDPNQRAVKTQGYDRNRVANAARHLETGTLVDDHEKDIFA